MQCKQAGEAYVNRRVEFLVWSRGK